VAAAEGLVKVAPIVQPLFGPEGSHSGVEDNLSTMKTGRWAPRAVSLALTQHVVLQLVVGHLLLAPAATTCKAPVYRKQKYEFPHLGLHSQLVTVRPRPLTSAPSSSRSVPTLAGALLAVHKQLHTSMQQ
jgi:hypothetical protein